MYNIERLIRGENLLKGLSYEEQIDIFGKQIVEKYSGNLRPDGLYDFSGDVFINSKNLYWIPKIFGVVNGGFYCSYNQLQSLEGCPKSVGGGFYCSYNQLQSLEGCPESVGGDFWCHNNHLKSLEGSPESVGGDFWCHNNHLKSLEGCPEYVRGHFLCYHNQFKSLEGCPEGIGGDFWCYGNLTQFTEEEVRERCKVGGRIHV